MSFSSSVSGKVMKVSGRNRKSSSSQSGIAKSLLSNLQNNWRNITVIQREAWQQYSVFRPVEQRNNPGRYINGQQYYLRYNSALFKQFSVIQNAVSFNTTTPFSTQLGILSAAGVLSVLATDPIDEANDFVMFKISAPMPASRKQPVGGTKQIVLTFGNTNACDITAAYIALFGKIPVAGQSVFIEYTFFKANFIQWSAPTAVRFVVV